ncbi:MAG TPA: aromatic/alkene monooxygenase hydroxylase subunit beta [Rhodocyclaceae bacterium]|nr:aromatic/alkene monooxygenase hydroxylase subunit beta [Rhodocyclaceae bacterium]
MSEIQVLKPQKTWSHLAVRRRKPSEYEIVSANLHYNDRDPNAPYELDPGMFMNEWYKKHTFGTALKHADWNAFRDPDEVVYRTYNMMQDGQETYVFGLFDQFNEREHDKALDPRWAGTLARLYTPARYLFHTLQMASAYVGQVSPASTITNCHYFQMADSLRWLSHTAYRTTELARAFADKGFGRDERHYWEEDAVWQGFRELMEKALTVWDWGEAIVVLNLVVMPAVEETVLRRLGEAARHNGDTLLGLLTDAQLIDVARHRRWAAAFVAMALETPGNRELIAGWIAQWEPLADRAIDAYCAALPDVPEAAAAARAATRDLRRSLGF